MITLAMKYKIVWAKGEQIFYSYLIQISVKPQTNLNATEMFLLCLYSLLSNIHYYEINISFIMVTVNDKCVLHEKCYLCTHITVLTDQPRFYIWNGLRI